MVLLICAGLFVRTLGNVTLDVAVTAAVDRSAGGDAPEA